MGKVLTIDRHRRRVLLPSGVLGTILFVLSEIMFFAALISAFLVIRASRGAEAFIPPEGVYLPVMATAFNTLILVLSGVSLFLATRAYDQEDGKDRAGAHLLRAIILGTFFVVFQGYEWVGLISHGMTMLSGVFGATFFLIIGSHGLHAAAAVIVMAFLYLKYRSKKLKSSDLQAMQVFWFFVVGVWPVLYGLVYF